MASARPRCDGDYRSGNAIGRKTNNAYNPNEIQMILQFRTNFGLGIENCCMAN